MREAGIKRRICLYLEEQGFYTYLNIVTNKNGIADVTVITPEGSIFMIETKSPLKKMAMLQEYRRDEINKKTGVKTFRLDNLEDLKRIINEKRYLPNKG